MTIVRTSDSQVLYDERLSIDEDDRLSRVGALVEGSVHETTSVVLP